MILEENVNKPRMIRALSVMWGLAGGGISHYVSSIEKLNRGEDVTISHVIIRHLKWSLHRDLWNQLTHYEILIRSRVDGAWVPKLISIIRKLEPHVLLVHGFNGFLVEGICRCFMNNIPVLATYHGEYFPSTMLRRMISGVVNGYAHFYLKRLAKNIIVVSEKDRKSLIMSGVNPDKIAVIYNGIPYNVDIDHYSRRILDDFALPQNAFVIGTTSSFHPIKGHSFLLEAMPKVIVRYPNVHLVLFGKGTLEKQLQKLCKSLNIEKNVHFTGFVDNVNRYIQGLDVFVLPSLSEAHSIGLLEAMRAACPIVCTDVGGNSETIRDGKDGFVVAPGDSNALRDAIIFLIKNENRRKSLAASARNRFLDHFTEERMLCETLDSIKKCVSIY